MRTAYRGAARNAIICSGRIAMSKHTGRKQRWTQVNAHTHTSALGKVAYQQDGWYALLKYRTLVPSAEAAAPASWEAVERRLGPFKRPRDAMVALEREVTFLRNHHGKNVLIADEVWAEG